MGLGSLLFSLPHFLTGPYRYISGSTNLADNVIMILMSIMLVVMVVVVVEAFWWFNPQRCSSVEVREVSPVSVGLRRGHASETSP